MTVKGTKPEKYPKMTEDELQKHVVDLFKENGWFVFFIPNWMYKLAMASIRRGRRRDRVWPESGLPDIIALQGLGDKREPARLLFMELKSATGTLQATQRNWLLALRRVPGVESYIFHPKDWRSGDIQRICMNGPMDKHPGTEKLLSENP